ncbi:hypothetical protein AVEN_213565-1 [Araneus ventricosus]|uniref:Uncharacterized protein n=1 Tax=Araneus ventricosus TaxID=182803 RepID=A0A4Y2JNE5_ARAVE|nr:hypothetical protein AVEN_213565-1 [Araneus ventricosus]
MKQRSYEVPTLLKAKPLMFFKVKQFARYPLQMPKASRALAQSEGHVSCQTNQIRLALGGITGLRRLSILSEFCPGKQRVRSYVSGQFWFADRSGRSECWLVFARKMPFEGSNLASV